MKKLLLIVFTIWGLLVVSLIFIGIHNKEQSQVIDAREEVEPQLGFDDDTGPETDSIYPELDYNSSHSIVEIVLKSINAGNYDEVYMFFDPNELLKLTSEFNELSMSEILRKKYNLFDVGEAESFVLKDSQTITSYEAVEAKVKLTDQVIKYLFKLRLVPDHDHSDSYYWQIVDISKLN